MNSVVLGRMRRLVLGSGYGCPVRAALAFLLLAPGVASAGPTTRVSVDSFGNEGNGHSGIDTGTGDARPAISFSGRFVAFDSLASNLVGVGMDMNGKSDIFVRDRK